jgi:hypothetical protein
MTLEQLEQATLRAPDRRGVSTSTRCPQAEAGDVVGAHLDDPHRNRCAGAVGHRDPGRKAWLEQLTAWRKTLCDELLALPARIRTNSDHGKRMPPSVRKYRALTGTVGEGADGDCFEPLPAHRILRGFPLALSWTLRLSRDLDHSTVRVPVVLRAVAARFALRHGVARGPLGRELLALRVVE